MQYDSACMLVKINNCIEMIERDQNEVPMLNLLQIAVTMIVASGSANMAELMLNFSHVQVLSTGESLIARAPVWSTAQGLTLQLEVCDSVVTDRDGFV